jgi:hypothetical protein
MFQSIWTIFRELMLVLTKVTPFKILPLKYSVKILSVLWFCNWKTFAFCKNYSVKIHRQEFYNNKNYENYVCVSHVRLSGRVGLKHTSVSWVRSEETICARHCAGPLDRHGVTLLNQFRCQATDEVM